MVNLIKGHTHKTTVNVANTQVIVHTPNSITPRPACTGAHMRSTWQGNRRAYGRRTQARPWQAYTGDHMETATDKSHLHTGSQILCDCILP